MPKVQYRASENKTLEKFLSYKKRRDIVFYWLAHHHDHQKTANQYQILYQQVYPWVKKYEDGGQRLCESAKFSRSSDYRPN